MHAVNRFVKFSEIFQKNHLKENFKRLKDIQAKAKQKSAEKQPLKPLKALNKYSQVQPKVSEVFNVSIFLNFVAFFIIVNDYK